MSETIQQRQIRVYVAGPMTLGNSSQNIANGIRAGEELRRRGFVPFIPHLSYFWEMLTGELTLEEWLAYDFEWLRACDCVLRLPGESRGADAEVAEAGRLGIPVFISIDKLEQFWKTTGAMR